MSQAFLQLEFRVRHSPARRGEEVYAVGEHPSLGCWDPAQAVKLRHSPGEGVWLSAPVSVPAGVSIQYKYLLFCEGRFERWEAFDGNRTIGAATSRAGSRHSLVPPDDELDVLPAPPEPRWSAGASTPPPTPAGLAEADGTTGVSGQLSALDVGEGGSVIVVSYILPLLITRERETASWAIDWNLDSVLARRASAGRAEGKRVLWIGCPGVAVAEADRASLTEALVHYSAVPVFLEPETQKAPLRPATPRPRQLVFDSPSPPSPAFSHTLVGSPQVFYTDFCRAFLWPVFHNARTAGRRARQAERRIEPGVLENVEASAFATPSSLLLASPAGGNLSPLTLSPLVPRRGSSADGAPPAGTAGGCWGAQPAKPSAPPAPPTATTATMFAPPPLAGPAAAPPSSGPLVVPRLSSLGQHSLGGAHAAARSPLLSPLPSPIARKESDAALAMLLTRLDDLLASGALPPPRGILLRTASLHACCRGQAAGCWSVERLKGLPLKLIAFEQLLCSASKDGSAASLGATLAGVKACNFTPAVQADYETVAPSSTWSCPPSRSRSGCSSGGAYTPLSSSRRSSTQCHQHTLHTDIRRAYAAVFTSVREGLNTYPLEAVFARRNVEPGVVVLSEFASCSRVLNGAIRAERDARRQRDMEFVINNTASAWAERFVLDLQAVAEEKPRDAQWETIGFGLAGFHRAGWRSDFTALDTTEVLTAYRRARRRALFLDWGGTLVPIEAFPRPFLDLSWSLPVGGTLVPIEDGFTSHLVEYFRERLSPAVHACLHELASDPRNLLMVLSGQESGRMDAAFSSLGHASLAAEHGFCYRLGSLPGVRLLLEDEGRGLRRTRVRRPHASEWRQLLPDNDLSWKETVATVMEAYKVRTNGAQTEVKGSSLVWKFDEVDPEFGLMQAKEMCVHLNTVLANCPVAIITGKGYVEVGGVDFILCIGDDSADEFMFQALHARFADRPAGTVPALFTCVVGRKPSSAQYYVNGADEVLELCQSLRLHSTRANRNLSTSDLKGLGRGRVPIRGEGPLNSSMDGSTMRAVFAATRGTSTPFALPAGHGARLASIAASPPPGQRAELGTVDGAAEPIKFTVGQ
ncbi:hypothetical protein EMIHUDRAFT_465622 [Emiliania huxleyi CCMP1516]|uniref:CBM20 domain-containing protein n=2 Tax=Emiliania huxleyi TaxID=2903 RepID=A0A0D3IA34_EMIH1|nr:hypothetical protein EMIHUDRAFT_465622 [Emiliania huxleyi CCMP1516]EOD08119.1 hypothetical protein EMIHUDRAFT_465622 [Emiliania huxleyi CCMP1516]|eukprot:XP_005760548.1 hypothetical protein EMIHUDRAFT_465622 [Emiliania huxleyi CCMP1516]